MVEEVSGDGWLSDESSFYGGEDEKERLETLVDNFIGESFWQKRNRNPDHIARLTRRAREMSSSDLHNIYQGRPDSWQLGESVADFLRRLPPLATPESFSPWIWVANPYANGRDRSSRAQNVVGELTIRGKKLLEESLLERDNIRKANSQSKGKANRLLNQESENLNERITQLAVELNVLSGKWMLFPEPSEVADIWWAKVVEGTIIDRLGSAAKIATSAAPVICIYTKDFRDVDDIRRVLEELVAIGLVRPGRVIAYKPDTYTYLDIYKANAEMYGLRASLYTSNKLLL